MDLLETLLNGPRARDAFLLRSLLTPPWAVRIQDEAQLTLVSPVVGDAWIVPVGEDPVHLAPGDVALVTGPEPYVVCDDPGTQPQVVVNPGAFCASADDGRSLIDEWTLGVRTWGHAADAEGVLLTGTYESVGEVSRPVLAALPRVAVVPRSPADDALREVLADQMRRAAPGQRALLDRLLDALLITTLRSWFEAQDVRAPGWFRAQGDPVVARAFEAIHSAPDHAWTVPELAGRAGVSRAVLARRFTEVVGIPPMAYLTQWRLAMAADLLRASDATVDAIARQVGYGTAFALSAAFKRAYGVSPREHRTSGLAS